MNSRIIFLTLLLSSFFVQSGFAQSESVHTGDNDTPSKISIQKKNEGVDINTDEQKLTEDAPKLTENNMSYQSLPHQNPRSALYLSSGAIDLQPLLSSFFPQSGPAQSGGDDPPSKISIQKKNDGVGPNTDEQKLTASKKKKTQSNAFYRSITRCVECIAIAYVCTIFLGMVADELRSLNPTKSDCMNNGIFDQQPLQQTPNNANNEQKIFDQQPLQQTPNNANNEQKIFDQQHLQPKLNKEQKKIYEQVIDSSKRRIDEKDCFSVTSAYTIAMIREIDATLSHKKWSLEDVNNQLIDRCKKICQDNKLCD